MNLCKHVNCLFFWQYYIYFHYVLVHSFDKHCPTALWWYISILMLSSKLNSSKEFSDKSFRQYLILSLSFQSIVLQIIDKCQYPLNHKNSTGSQLECVTVYTWRDLPPTTALLDHMTALVCKLYSALFSQLLTYGVVRHMPTAQMVLPEWTFCYCI